MDTQEFTPDELLGPLTEFEEKYAPAQLFVLGDVELLRQGPRVAVVGSRAVSVEGGARARILTKALVDHDITVVSGLANGIDTVAHTVAIEAGGRTVAVVGTPLDKVYPASNRNLFEIIKTRHAAVSQFPMGHPTQPKNFVLRNRTMALLSDATVIVEAGAKSGTEHQGWEALRLGRLVFIMKSVLEAPDVAWARKMVEYGAQELSRENLHDVLENLPAFTASGELAF